MSSHIAAAVRPPAPLDASRPLYFLPRDDLAGEVLIPGFRHASAARCMVGFFSSSVLADLAPGLATYIAAATTGFRLIVSPYLTDADRQAIAIGLRNPEDVGADILRDGLVGTNELQRHTLECLSFLLARGRIEMKVALMKDALFHPKVWLFSTSAGTFAAHGSSNMTVSGIRKNKEQITVSKAWADPTQKYIVEKLQDEFDVLWANKDDDCIVLPLPDAVKQDILRNYPAERAPTEDDFRALYKRAKGDAPSETQPGSTEPLPVRPQFAIPSWLQYEDGAYAHQGRAVRAWVEARYRGTLEMATGSGKTLTSMVAAHYLYRNEKPLLITIAAPYVPLIEQWCSEVGHFGLQPSNLTVAGNAADRASKLQNLRRKLRLGISDVEAIVVSHDTLCTPEFTDQLSSFECAKLLIADEAHNLGRPSFINNPPELFQFRLALSATPVRQYDPEGTDAVFDFFGPVVFRFTLKDAIGVCLVEYDYFIHPVALTPLEMDAWSDLTARIRQNAWRLTSGKPDDYLTKLFRDRRALLETARGKIAALETLITSEMARELRHALVYTTDKGPDQLRTVNRFLNERGVLFHQLTADETADREQTARIIKGFQRGDIQVLTAKRVLDEGVNIPEISTAYILASTTVERQWIQRRGRLLRTCPEIGKTHSVIHDFLALPPLNDGHLDDDARALIKGELRRAQEFASLARNAGRPDGPLQVIHRLVTAALM